MVRLSERARSGLDDSNVEISNSTTTNAPKKFKDAELQADEHPSQTQEELAKSLGFTQVMGMVHEKDGKN